ncbi:MAG: zf-HC2 domain-containing protein [Candidatus Omnitrophota bacterium]
MKNRLCPTEEILSEYLSGTLPQEERRAAEKHLAGCTKCRKLVVEAHEITSGLDFSQIKRSLMKKNNYWFLGAVIAFILSFIFTKYFLQFLVACLLMGGKWIIDSKTTKMLVMIYEAWKSGDREATDKILKEVSLWKKSR